MKKYSLITILLLFTFIDLYSQDCIIENITDKVISCKCDYKEEHRSFTIISKSGMIQIDSYYFPWLTKNAKDSITSETGRNDFRYLINTHGHACHIGGNFYFRDATFVAHEKTKDKIEWGISQSKNEYDKLLAVENRDSTHLIRLKKLEQQIKNSFLPQITFNDRLDIYLDDLSIRLIYFGKCGHADDEILIHIPKEKTLIIGQVFHGSKYLPIIKYPCDRQDLERKIEIMTQLIENDLEHILSNHQGEIDISDFKFARDYYADLLTNIEDLRNKSYSLDQIQAKFKFKNRYPEINEKHKIKEDRENVHIKNVENVWKMFEKEN